MHAEAPQAAGMDTHADRSLTFDEFNLGSTPQDRKTAMLRLMQNMSPGVQYGAATGLLAAFHAGERTTDKAASDLFAGFILFAHDDDADDAKADGDDVCIYHISSLSGEANKHIDPEMLARMGTWIDGGGFAPVANAIA